MSEEHKPGQNGLPDDAHTNEAEAALAPADLASGNGLPEKLGREPLIKFEQAGGRTTLTIDLDGIAEEANAALVKSFEDLRETGEYDSQAALLELMAACHARMEVLGINDAELARKMDVTRSYVSRLFNAPPNLTVVSMAKLARALGGKIKITVDFG